MAEALRDDFVRTYDRELPSAVACFLDDFDACIAHLRFPVVHRRSIRTTTVDACIAHLRFPVVHRRSIRTTNMLERLYEEERRRLKIIPNTFGERPVLKLMYATIIRASERWRGLKITIFERKQLEVIQQELDDVHRQRQEPVRPSKAKQTPSRVSSRVGT